ncbi:MAG: CooT family nickel-binding protein [Syntrophobacteraceae bacterium]
MCEANAYLLKEGKEQLILEAVDKVESDEGRLKIENIFGEQKVIQGRIRSMSLVDHRIVIEE